jgi:2-phospho-L-lactate guanylyltransferase
MPAPRGQAKGGVRVGGPLPPVDAGAAAPGSAPRPGRRRVGAGSAPPGGPGLRHDGRVPEPSWTILVPVKDPARAKTRLRGVVPSHAHAALVRALAADTVAAALACPHVGRVVLLAAPGTDAAGAPPGVTVLRPPVRGLNRELSWAAAALAGTRVAVLTGDLAALRPHELATALRSASAYRRCFVPDADGTGSTMLAVTGGRLDPRFGPGSARAHRESGAAELPAAGPGLRRDVDTAADLAAARLLGLGARTRAVLSRTGTVDGVRQVQGTVATFDPDSRSGTVLLDDGSPVDFPAAAFDASGLRLLRLGQRLRLDLDDAGVVAFVTIPTLT